MHRVSFVGIRWSALFLPLVLVVDVPGGIQTGGGIVGSSELTPPSPNGKYSAPPPTLSPPLPPLFITLPPVLPSLLLLPPAGTPTNVC